MKRGDVVIVEFPYVDGGRGKLRPALIIQNDGDNVRLANTVVAMISGNVRFATEPTQVLIDPAKPDGASSGLNGPSVVKCCNLFTVRIQDIRKTIGNLSLGFLNDVDTAIKVALSLS